MDNSVNRQDGFFLGRISRSIFKNGILGQKIGDSITFADVKVWGKNNVDLSGMPSNVSALGVTFQRGQITTENGFLILRDMDSVRIKDMWMEGNPTQPGYTVASAIQINNSHDVQIDGLMIAVPQNGSSAAPYQVIGMDQSKETKIRNSTFLNKAASAHIYGNASTVRTKLDSNTCNNRNTPEVPPPPSCVVVLQGS